MKNKKSQGKPKEQPKPKELFVKCADCGGKYKAGAPHYMFCPAKTCSICGTTYSYVIEPDKDGNRVCEKC